MLAERSTCARATSCTKVGKFFRTRSKAGACSNRSALLSGIYFEEHSGMVHWLRKDYNRISKLIIDTRIHPSSPTHDLLIGYVHARFLFLISHGEIKTCAKSLKFLGMF